MLQKKRNGSVKKKNMLCKCFLNNPDSSNENAYKSYKNKLTHSLRVAKRLYYEKQIKKNLESSQ